MYGDFASEKSTIVDFKGKNHIQRFCILSVKHPTKIFNACGNASYDYFQRFRLKKGCRRADHVL